MSLWSAHYGPVTPYGEIGLGQHLRRWWLVCMTAPNHCFNQYWLIIKGVLWGSPEGNSTANSLPTNLFRNMYFIMTSSNGNIFRITGPLCGEFTGPGEFPTQRPVTRSFDVFFDLRLNKRLSKQPWGWLFEAPSWSLWRPCNVETTILIFLPHLHGVNQLTVHVICMVSCFVFSFQLFSQQIHLLRPNRIATTSMTSSSLWYIPPP